MNSSNFLFTMCVIFMFHDAAGDTFKILLFPDKDANFSSKGSIRIWLRIYIIIILYNIDNMIITIDNIDHRYR